MKSESVKHTPGPWKVEYNEAIYAKSTYGEPDLRVADVHGEDTPQREANARLIAAAPELLKACRALLDAIGMFGRKEGPIGIARDVAKAAINKATGGINE